MVRSIGYFIALVFLNCNLVAAQQKDYEIKVISRKVQNVKGLLQKVSAEGIAVEDYKGNYLIFRAEDLVKIKVRHRGLTVWKGTVNGAVAGGVLVGGLAAADSENADGDVVAVGLIVAAGITAIGAISGLVAEAVNTKLIMYIDGNKERYQEGYKKLEKYVRVVPTQRF